jgi:phage terminase large subunit GpA-like protein
MAPELYLEQTITVEADEYEGAVARPPNPRDLVNYARSLRIPAGPQGPREGGPGDPYSPESHPAQHCLLQELARGHWHRMVVVACTQDGKSWVIQIFCFWITTELREPLVYGLPDMRFAADVWREKIQPGMEHSGLRDFLPRVGPGSGGGSNVTTIVLNGGGLWMFLGAGGKNKAGAAGRTARAVVVDEFGKIKPTLATKFDRRADAYGEDGYLLKAGTVESDRDDQLLEQYFLSTRSRLWYRCHHCQGFTPLDWEQVTYDKASDSSARASARVACRACGAQWTDVERKANLIDWRLVHHGQHADPDGIVRGAAPDTTTLGLLWCALDSPRRSLEKLCADHRSAEILYDRGNAQPLIDFWHDELARAFPRRDEESENVTTSHLAGRSAGSGYHAQRLSADTAQWQVAVIPPDIEWTTAAVDQSKRRLWYVIRGHHRDGRTWILGWGRIPVCGDLEEPTPQQRIAALDRLNVYLMRGIPHATAGIITTAINGVDIGYARDLTLEWIGQHPGWLAVRGTGDEQMEGMSASSGKVQAERRGWYLLREYGRQTGAWCEVLWIDSDSVKLELTRAMRREIGSPGSAMLPTGLAADDRLLQHLTSEEWLPNASGTFEWKQVGRFNDWFDCAYYTQALHWYVLDRLPDRIVTPGTPDQTPSQSDDNAGESPIAWN